MLCAPSPNPHPPGAPEPVQVIRCPWPCLAGVPSVAADRDRQKEIAIRLIKIWGPRLDPPPLSWGPGSGWTGSPTLKPPSSKASSTRPLRGRPSALPAVPPCQLPEGSQHRRLLTSPEHGPIRAPVLHPYWPCLSRAATSLGSGSLLHLSTSGGWPFHSCLSDVPCLAWASRHMPRRN